MPRYPLTFLLLLSGLLGVCLSSRIEARPKDKVKAMKALEAAEKYLYGEGVRKSANRAISLFKQARKYLPQESTTANIAARISIGLSVAYVERKKYKDGAAELEPLAEGFAKRNIRWEGRTWGSGPTVEWDRALKKCRKELLAGGDMDEISERLSELAREAGDHKMGKRHARIAQFLLGVIFQKKKKFKDACDRFTPLAREQAEYLDKTAAQTAKREAARPRTSKTIPKAEKPPGELKGKYKEAVAKGLVWLTKFQKPDGEWSEAALDSLAGHDPLPAGRTRCYPSALSGALAAMALLRAGVKTDDSPQGLALKKGLDWIVKAQGGNGFIPKGSKAGHPNIIHSIYTWVLAEAVLRLEDPEPWKKPLEKGVSYLLAAQNPGLGWRFGIRPGDNDTEHTAQAVLALIRAKTAGVEIPGEAIDGAVTWFDKVTDEVTGKSGYWSKGDQGTVRADARNFKAVDTATALVLTSRILLGENPGEGLLGRGFDTLWNRPPQWIPDKDIHLLYARYYTLAYGLKPGADSNFNLKRMADLLVKNQETEGGALGSWPPIGAMAAEGRIVSTARAILSILNARGVNMPEPLEPDED
ncbi:MAG: prenyltransferase/squalene oxidase repeat-containing protein [Planctomycetota bacterium]|jgi:hypothetical protein